MSSDQKNKIWALLPPLHGRKFDKDLSSEKHWTELCLAYSSADDKRLTMAMNDAYKLNCDGKLLLVLVLGVRLSL